LDLNLLGLLDVDVGLYSTVDCVEPVVVPIRICSCEELINIRDANGYYVLVSSLNCTLSGPLFPGVPFTGIFDGNLHTLGLEIYWNCPAGLFYTFSGVIANLTITGHIRGIGYTGAISPIVTGGSILSVGIYANIINAGVSVVSSQISVAGGFFGWAQPSAQITFQYCICQAHISAVDSTLCNYASGYIGAFINSGLNLDVDVLGLINLQACISLPLLTATTGVDAFLLPLLDTSLQLCVGAECNNNMFCEASYFDQTYNSLCSSLRAPAHIISCPPVVYQDNHLFYYPCYHQHEPHYECDEGCGIVCIRGYKCIRNACVAC